MSLLFFVAALSVLIGNQLAQSAGKYDQTLFFLVMAALICAVWELESTVKKLLKKDYE